MFDMGGVGVGEGVERQALRGALKQGRDARISPAKISFILQELGVRQLDAEQGAECGKKFGVADLAFSCC